MPKKPPIIDVCKLCLKARELRYSHIVSNLFWQNSQIFRHIKYFEIEAIAGNALKLKNQQTGLREYLLCEECEQRFSKWEAYGETVFYGTGNQFDHPPKEIFMVTGIDYRPFKLLTLSIFWRMAVSKHPYYSRVQIPGRKMEQLRQMLLNDNPGVPTCYGCIFTTIVNKGGTPYKALFSAPMRLPPDPLVTAHYGFIIAGVHWHIFAHRRVKDSMLTDCFVQSDGKLLVRVDTPNGFPYLQTQWEYERKKRVFPPSSLRT